MRQGVRWKKVRQGDREMGNIEIGDRKTGRQGGRRQKGGVRGQKGYRTFLYG